MAIDQNSPPKEVLHINPNCKPTNALGTSFHIVSSSTSTAAAYDHSSGKVKMLCSFGGKILPRPSDGALRYAGGHTRIISVSYQSTYPEFYRQMADVYGGPVAIRYQLPEEELDVLISVSSEEDLDNMMVEHDKMADASRDGSAKLRIFLFPPSEISLATAEISSEGLTISSPCERGKMYIEAINGLVAGPTEAAFGFGGIQPKDSTVSAASTQNSDVHADGPNNECKSPATHPPGAEIAALHDSSRAAFMGNATSETEYEGFRTNSPIVVQTEVAAQTLNPQFGEPYASQAFVDPQQVQYITPHSLPMARGPRMLNVIAIPEHLYLSSMRVPSLSVPSHPGDAKQIQGAIEPYFEENQNGGRILPHVPDPNYKLFQRPLSQLPPLRPSNMPPLNAEYYGLHPLPPLHELQGFGLEDCPMSQKTLARAHSDKVLNEQGFFSGVYTSEAFPALRTHHSEDITRLQSQHREVRAGMMDSLIESKVENVVNPGQFDICVNRFSEETLEKEKLVVPNADKFHHSNSKQLQDTMGFSGDTEESHGAFVNPSQLYHEGKLLQQHQVLHGRHFDNNNFLHIPDAVGFSSTSHAPYGTSLSLPQALHDDFLQQKKVNPADLLNHNMYFGIMGHTAASQTPSGLFLCHPQLYHEDSPQQLQQLQKQLLDDTIPFSSAIKEDVLQKALDQGSSSMENIECQVPPPLSNSSREFFHDFVKSVDGRMQALYVSDLENKKLNEKFNPVVTNLIFSKDMKTETSTLVGEQNQAVRSQDGANIFLKSKSPRIAPECVSVRPDNTMFSNVDISKDMNPEIGSVMGTENSTFCLHNCAQNFLSSNASSSSGILSEHVNVTDISASVPIHGTFSQIFQGNTGPSALHDAPCPTDYSYQSGVNMPPAVEWNNGASVVHPKDLDKKMTAVSRGSVQFQFSQSSCNPGNLGQLIQIPSSDILLCNQDPWKIMQMCPQSATTLVVSKDMSYCNLPNSKGTEVGILLEEGALQLPVDPVKKDSPPESFQVTQDYKQDLLELAEELEESVVQSSTTPSPASCPLEPNDSSTTFPIRNNISEDGEGSDSIPELGDEKLEDMKIKQSDMHFCVPLADDIGRLQVIKNIDLEELRELGSGTFGTVFHGRWRGSEVAIKRINDRCFSGKPSEQERMRTDFWNEATKLADLHHPNVLAFYGIVLDGPDGSFATVTEYMVNGSLRNALQSNENRNLCRRKRLSIATDVAFGMEYLHGKNIVHFDLKSDNLLVNLRDPQRPICKVGDLGLSKVKCKTLISGGVRGTLPWMAPELLNGSSNLVSEKVDVFSFGIVLWELLTGQEPYADLHYGAIIGGIVNNTLRPLVPESCEPEWKELMEQCWSAEPSGRPSFTQISNRLRLIAACTNQKAQAPPA